MTMNEIRKSMKKFVEEQDTFELFEELYKNGSVSSPDDHFNEIVRTYHADVYNFGGTIYASKKIVREILESFIKFLEEINAEETTSSDEVIEDTSSSDEKCISSATILTVFFEKGIAVKGYVDRLEVDLTFNTIQKFNSHFNSHDMGFIKYDDMKWSFSSDEETVTRELLHKLVELYDENVTPDKIWMKGKSFTPIEFIDFLYMKELYFILSGICSYEKGFFHIYHGYATKKLLLDMNKSNVFNKWQSIAPISKSAFLEGVKWICSDTSPEESHYTRALSLTPDGLIKLTATYSVTGYKYFDENGKIYSGTHFKRKALTDKERLFADENGNLSTFCKIILSSKDRV